MQQDYCRLIALPDLKVEVAAVVDVVGFDCAAASDGNSRANAMSLIKTISSADSPCSYRHVHQVAGRFAVLPQLGDDVDGALPGWGLWWPADGLHGETPAVPDH